MGILFCIALGAAIGAFAFGALGVLPGALLGYLLAAVQGLSRRIDSLERAVMALDSRSSREKDSAPFRKEDSRPKAAIEETSAEFQQPAHEAVAHQTAEALPVDEVPAKAARDTDAEEWLGSIRNHVEAYLTTGNLLVKVGVIVLFIGVAFLLRYAAVHIAF